MVDIDEVNIKELLKEFNNSIENIDEKEARQFIQERLNISNDIDVMIKKYGDDKIIVIIQQLLDRLDTALKQKTIK